MKIKLLMQKHSEAPIASGAMGEALGYEITHNSVVLKCVFYGHTGVHRIDIRDALSLTEV